MNFKGRFIQQRKDFAELMKHYPFTTETLVGEEWRDIEGYNGKYQISNYGRIKSFYNKTPRILTPFLVRCTGYLACVLRLQGKRGERDIHRLVAKAFIPNPDNKPQVNHIDGCRWNSVVSNLEWCTPSENTKHAYDLGLINVLQGANRSDAKLTNEQVLYIRENPDNLSCNRLAEKFGTCRHTIQCAQLGKRYRNAGGITRDKNMKFAAKLSPEDKQKIYRLYQTGEYTQKRLGEMFGVHNATISSVVRNFDKNIGRVMQDKKRIPAEVRQQIRAEYKKGARGHGVYELERKYGIGHTTIQRIVSEK